MEPFSVVNILLLITIINSKEILLKKIFKYCIECDADIYFILRMKKTDQLYTLISNTKEWPLSTEQINKESNYSELIQMKMNELAIKY
ncbi:unnamed protein product [Penicillium salamii]|nr:unnamed protein product [Penicillium salamii]CAG8210839.1 unnamed protein product [Penicillium salamii]CAG8213511.1 unnamed protein product [Penicillium salamii]CAG8403491.1 unnamed protein product [Penicillium salamii]